ncbi:hypothetical protein GFJ91_23900, partial [Salmonella enterica subsp. enterica serovar Enteritidis]|nr:hypothetical protein [Salmonella enterica subsp. enterica serovar Enteritidis]
NIFRQTGGETFVIVCSDHGTCYGEDGKYFHSFNHPIVNTVPYMHFLLKNAINNELDIFFLTILLDFFAVK